MIIVETLGILTAFLLIASILTKRMQESSCDCARGRGIHIWLRNFSAVEEEDEATNNPVQ